MARRPVERFGRAQSKPIRDHHKPRPTATPQPTPTKTIRLFLAHRYDLVTSFADVFGEFLNPSLAVTEESIAKRPEQVQAFANAMQKACLFGHKYPDQTVESIKRYQTRILRSSHRRRGTSSKTTLTRKAF